MKLHSYEELLLLCLAQSPGHHQHQHHLHLSQFLTHRSFTTPSFTALSPHLPSPFIFPAFVPYPFALSMIFISAYEWVLGLKSKTYHRVTSRASKYYLPICDVSHVRVGLKTNVRERESQSVNICNVLCVYLPIAIYIYINK